MVDCIIITAIILITTHSHVDTTMATSTSPITAAIADMARDIDVECRSSASSDVDSESDVFFDDLASDQSDGSDKGAEVAAQAINATTTTTTTTMLVCLFTVYYNNNGVSFG